LKIEVDQSTLLREKFLIYIDESRIVKVKDISKLIDELRSSTDFYNKRILYIVVCDGEKEKAILYIIGWLINPYQPDPGSYCMTLFKAVYTTEERQDIVRKIKENDGGYIVVDEDRKIIDITRKNKPQHYQCTYVPLISPILEEEKVGNVIIGIERNSMKKA
jgi:hypothetical protein